MEDFIKETAGKPEIDEVLENISTLINNFNAAHKDNKAETIFCCSVIVDKDQAHVGEIGLASLQGYINMEQALGELRNRVKKAALQMVIDHETDPILKMLAQTVLLELERGEQKENTNEQSEDESPVGQA
jgi:hypothetical protein